MRLAVALVAPLFSAAALAAPTPTDPPQRLPGLWAIDTTPASEAAGVQSFHLCIGTSDRDVLRRPGHDSRDCRSESWSKDEHYRYYSAECTVKGSSARIEGRFTGDFQYNYHGELTTTYAPALDGATEVRMEVAGRRLAPCKPEHPVGKLLIQGQDGVGNLNVGEPVIKLR